MIDTALSFLADQVNAYLIKRTGTELGAVNLGPVVDDRGNWTGPIDTVRLFLFQIDEERTLRAQMPERTLIGGRDLVMPPPLQVNLVVVFAGRFQHYDQALRTLSLILTFFQARPLFTPSDSPALPADIERLALDLISYGPEQMSQMWTCFGAKHLPSLVYRIRCVVLQDVEPQGSELPIMTVNTTLSGR